jgi:hypothetical protein
VAAAGATGGTTSVISFSRSRQAGIRAETVLTTPSSATSRANHCGVVKRVHHRTLPTLGPNALPQALPMRDGSTGVEGFRRPLQPGVWDGPRRRIGPGR